MANPFMDIFSGALGEANTQRTNNQQLMQALQSMVFEAKLKQMYDPEAQFRQQIMGLISGGGGGQPAPQPRPQTPIALQNIPGAAMSLPSGGIGNVQGQPIDLASALSRMQTQAQPQAQAQPQTQMQGQPPALSGGFRPTGFSYGGFTFENPEEKMRMKLEEQRLSQEEKTKVPTIQQRNDLLAVNNQMSNLKQLRSLAEKVPSGFSGMLGTAASVVSQGGMSTNTRLYLKNRPAYAVSIYRALTGDTRLSDADAKGRALPLLWHPAEPDTIRKQSFDQIESALLARKRLIEKGQYQVGKEGEFITPLEDVLAEAGVNISGNQLQGLENQQNEQQPQPSKTNRIGKYTFQ